MTYYTCVRALECVRESASEVCLYVGVNACTHTHTYTQIGYTYMNALDAHGTYVLMKTHT